MFQVGKRSVNFHRGLYLHDFTPQYMAETEFCDLTERSSTL